MPERRALLTGPIPPPLHRVDVKEGQRAGAGQQRRPRREPGQHPAVHCSQLTHVTVSESPQERAQCRGRPDPAERGRQRTMPQQVHPIKTVRTGDHARHQRTDLHPRVRAGPRRHLHMLGDQLLQTSITGQAHREHQPSMRHEIRIIERRPRLGRRMQQSHPRSALSTMGSGASATPILPGQGHFYCYDTHLATIWSVDPGSAAGITSPRTL